MGAPSRGSQAYMRPTLAALNKIKKTEKPGEADEAARQYDTAVWEPAVPKEASLVAKISVTDVKADASVPLLADASNDRDEKIDGRSI